MVMITLNTIIASVYNDCLDNYAPTEHSFGAISCLRCSHNEEETSND